MSIKSAISLNKMIFKEKTLIITPLLDPQKQINEGSASVDLRLGTRFLASRRGALTHIETQTTKSSEDISKLQDEYYVNFGHDFVLHPGHFVLAGTLEYMHLPPNLVGNVVTRSSWGRHGLIIATAVAIQPGYLGTLTLELRNLAEIPLKLYPGRRILQIFFHEVDKYNLSSFDKSTYLVSTKPTIGKFDSEVHEMKTLDNFKEYRKYNFTL